jgi:2-dehydro-3-deoxyphosphogluconate aldolase/(4S)-4-hydroxy-2-oxoglutarate aldolase
MTTLDSPAATLDAIGRAGVLPVVVLDDAAVSDNLAAVLVAAGLPAVEVTLRTPAALDAIARAADVPGALVGAGTVLTPRQVDDAVAAGARFVVSPGLDETVVRRARRREVAVVPGIATASDLMLAVRLRVRTVKFFPAEPLGGLATLSALAQPFPDMRFVPTGGVRADTIAAYLAHPSVLAVGGTWLATRETLRESGDLPQVTALARDARDRALAVRRAGAAS